MWLEKPSLSSLFITCDLEESKQKAISPALRGMSVVPLCAVDGLQPICSHYQSYK